MEENMPSVSKESVNNDNNNDETNQACKTAGSILPGYSTLNDFTQAGYKALTEGIRNSGMLPTSQNWNFFTCYPSFNKILDSEGSRILELISMILRHEGSRGNIVRRDFEEKYDMIVDANDTILERVGCLLDEMAGIRKNPEPVLMEAVVYNTKAVSGSWNVNHKVAAGSSGNMTQPYRLLSAKNIQRPQLKFKDKIDNSLSPFEPRIKEKPNSLKPLSILLTLNEDGEESYTHPYEYELDRFSPPDDLLKKIKPEMYRALDETPLVMVNKPEQLDALVQDLAQSPIIAVDLEHHSYRSFQGITCLMQISTRQTDYIIDTLELRDKLHCLNEIFTKKSIMKIFHGADHDVQWLQRDLSLYVVNMFDTFQASKLLNFPQLSLAFLLRHYCQVETDKHFQLADWRIRPLPNELLLYARQDTHYLIYVYEKMHNDLLNLANGHTNLLQATFQQSNQICKTRYEKPRFRDDSYMIVYRRNKKLYDNRQLYALRELYHWRENIARKEDESTGYILPNHMMLQIAEMIPREMQGILACCNPIPPVVRQNLLALHQLILKARDQPLVKPLLEEELRKRAPLQSWLKVNIDGALHCPHDLKHNQDFRDDLPTLLGSGDMTRNSEIISKRSLESTPTVSVFEVESCEPDNEPLKHVTFICPFDRYKKVKPFILSQEAQASVNEKPSIAQETKEDDSLKRIERIKVHFMKVNSQTNPEKNKMSHTNLHEKGEEDKTSSISTNVQGEKNEKSSSSNVNTPVEEGLETFTKKNTVKRKRSKTDQSNSEDGAHQIKKPKESNNPNSFEPFHFHKVNFSRFQGGSKVEGDQKLLATIKSKGKKKQSKRKNKNKSMTFERNLW